MSKAALLLAFSSLLIAADQKATLGASGPAASNNLHVPIVTFVVQDSGQVRPVVGAIGAAVLGDALTLPDGVTRMSVSPHGDLALAERADGQPLSVASLSGGAVGALQIITGAFAQSDRTEFSATGSAAALYSSSQHRVQAIANLQSTPAVQEFDVSSINSPVISMAVADDGSIVLLGASDGVYRLSSDKSITKILGSSVPAALRFIPQSDNAVLADTQANQVVLLSGVSGTPTAQVLATADAGLNGPTAVEVLADNRTIAANNSGANSLLLIDAPSGKTTAVSMLAPVVSMRTVQDRAGLALSTASPAGYWLLNGAFSGTPVISLIADLSAKGNQ